MKKTSPKNELKTKKNTRSVPAFIASIGDPALRKASNTVLKLMKVVTKQKPLMWGESMVGFGEYRYARRDGSEHTYFMTGFSPRAKNLTIYIMPGYADYGALLKKLGPHTLGKSCLYIKDLSKIHIPTLRTLITRGYADMKRLYKNT